MAGEVAKWSYIISCHRIAGVRISFFESPIVSNDYGGDCLLSRITPTGHSRFLAKAAVCLCNLRQKPHGVDIVDYMLSNCGVGREI